MHANLLSLKRVALVGVAGLAAFAFFSLPHSSPAAAPAAPAAAAAPKIIRIDAGNMKPDGGDVKPYVDAEGNTWLFDEGFDGGQTLDRGDIEISNTENPDIYRTERYSMDSFTQAVPNGKYYVKMHFAETFEGVTGKGERVFDIKVGDTVFKGFDVFARAGGHDRAYTETVPVTVTNGKIVITFTPNIENPEINGIEIIPVPAAK